MPAQHIPTLNNTSRHNIGCVPCVRTACTHYIVRKRRLLVRNPLMHEPEPCRRVVGGDDQLLYHRFCAGSPLTGALDGSLGCARARARSRSRFHAACAAGGQVLIILLLLHCHMKFCLLEFHLFHRNCDDRCKQIRHERRTPSTEAEAA